MDVPIFWPMVTSDETWLKSPNYYFILHVPAFVSVAASCYSTSAEQQ